MLIKKPPGISRVAKLVSCLLHSQKKIPKISTWRRHSMLVLHLSFTVCRASVSVHSFNTDNIAVKNPHLYGGRGGGAKGHI